MNMTKQQTDASRKPTKPLTQGQINDLCSILVKRQVLVELNARPDNSLTLTDEDRQRVVEALADEMAEAERIPADDRKIPMPALAELLGQIVENDGSETLEGYVDCSFCGTRFSISDKGKVVAGPNVFICRDCVGLCLDVMAEDDPEYRDQRIEGLNALKDKPKT